MLVTAKELIQDADKTTSGIGAFNVTSTTTLMAIMRAAEELNQPCIIEYAPVHEEADVIPFDYIAPLMVEVAKKSPVKICCHLDHGVHLEQVQKALEVGFSSVMYDGSALPYEENVENTKKAVEMAKAYGATVEGEIGKMAGYTMTNDNVIEDRELNPDFFTSPEEAKDFVEKTGIDMLACSFGNVHGIYKAEPNLDDDLVRRLREACGVPIVMHGGSGCSPEDYRKVINAGVRKINYYAYMAKAGGEAIQDFVVNASEYDDVKIHNLAKIGRDAMKENVKQAMICFQNKQ